MTKEDLQGDKIKKHEDNPKANMGFSERKHKFVKTSIYLL